VTAMQHVTIHGTIEDSITEAIRWSLLMGFLSFAAFSSCQSQQELRRIREVIERQTSPAASR
jgi:hypothetical protein